MKRFASVLDRSRIGLDGDFEYSITLFDENNSMVLIKEEIQKLIDLVKVANNSLKIKINI